MLVKKIIDNRLTIALLIAGIAFGYYFMLYSREFTWIYTSGDAGDWLTQLRWWIVPHAFGKPLFISLIHAVSFIPFGTDIDKITIFLSVIPGAITVGLTYLIAFHFTKEKLVSVIASLVILGAVIFTTQASIIEQYAFMGMLFAASYYFYITKHKVWCGIFSGLLAATHMVGIIFFAILLAREYNKIREWIKPSIMFFIFGIVPYIIIPIMMALDTPKIIAGSLSLQSIIEYMFGNPTSSISLAIVEFPKRIAQALGIVTISLGLAIIPLFKLKGKLDGKTLTFTLALIVFCSWFYMTNLFPSTWKFIAFILPAVCGLIAIGLTNMPKKEVIVIGLCAIALIIANGFVYNSNTLAKQDPLATQYSSFLQELPDGDGVLISRGGAYAFGLMYELSKGKDLVPIALSFYNEDVREKEEEKQSYKDYLVWAKEEYGIEGNNCVEVTQYILSTGNNVYFPNPQEYWFNTFEMTLIEPNNEIYQVTEILQGDVK